MHKKIMLLTAAAAVVVLNPAGNKSMAETGVNSSRILFGQSAALKGPAKALGQNMKYGLEAAFGAANSDGGVNGRNLKLNSKDDGYEPDKAIENSRHFIEERGVFALIGPVGTPTSKAAHPIAKNKGVPYIGPFTGAEFLRDPQKSPNVINIRASYFDETEAWAKFLVDDKGYDKIGILYQDDSYGRVGLKGFKKALARRDMEIAAEATYARNTTAVRSAALDLSQANVDAVVTVSAYEPVAAFIKAMDKIGLDIPVVNLSFTGSAALADALPSELSENVFVTQVVPSPTMSDLPIVKNYRSHLDKHVEGAEPRFVSLEAYLVGRITEKALAAMDGTPTRDGFLKTVADFGSFEMGGLRFSYSPEDNQGLDTIFMTTLQSDGSYKTVETYKNSD